WTRPDVRRRTRPSTARRRWEIGLCWSNAIICCIDKSVSPVRPCPAASALSVRRCPALSCRVRLMLLGQGAEESEAQRAVAFNVEGHLIGQAVLRVVQD